MEFNLFCTIFFCLLIITNANAGGTPFRQQNYNPSVDFLNHETSGNPSTPNKDYLSQFPPLNSPPGSTNRPNSPSSSPKRDYVAPQFSPLNSPTLVNAANTGQQNGITSPPKRDYVAPNFPSPNTPAPNNNKLFGEFPPLNSPSLVNNANKFHNGVTAPPKRDYVAPHLPSTPAPNNKQNGPGQPPKRDYVAPHLPSYDNNDNTGQRNKVKDLVNFYDNKAKDTNIPNNTPSYSSVVTRAPQTPSTGTTSKTPSFSAVVSGGNKPPNSNSNVPIPNSKPPTYVPTNPANKPAVNPSKPNLVLPTDLVQNHKNKNTGTDNGPTDTELQVLSEELLRKDINNAAKFITINHQEKTTSQSKDDKASLPLLTVSDDAWNIPTIKKIIPLLDNYERDTLVNEHVTPQERNEEIAFMDSIMSTTVIRHLMTFLKEKGYVTPDPKQQRDFLKQLWFNLYSRGKGKISSSGFEHVFVSELKNGEISGLHNWIYFSKEETANRVNYLGYLKYVQLNDKGTVMKLHFDQQGVDKPVDSMFIGTSPELEMALYTLCFVTRSDKDCTLKLGGKNVDIVTHTFRYRSKNLIGSAYPQI